MKKIFAAMTAALLIAALGSSAVFAAKATSTWKVYTFNASGQSYSSKAATTFPGVGVGVGFTS